jgi:hypothetical protein
MFTPTLGVESTPHALSTLKKVRPAAALLSSSEPSAPLSASTVICQREGLLGSAASGITLHDSTVCTGGGLHVMLPLRSTTNSTLAGISSET